MLLLLIAVGLFLQTSLVQNWLVDKVTRILSEKTTFRTEIGTIQLSWWDAVTFEKVQIFDQQDSLMIGAEQLYVDFSILSLLPPGDPQLDLIRIEKARIHLINHPGDSTLNINRWITALGEAFGSTSTEAPTSRFFINDLELRQSTFAYSDLQAPAFSTSDDERRNGWCPRGIGR